MLGPSSSLSPLSSTCSLRPLLPTPVSTYLQHYDSSVYLGLHYTTNSPKGRLTSHCLSTASACWHALSLVGGHFQPFLIL